MAHAAALVPVVDLRGGLVVRAVAGERARYAPVRSRLVDGAEPIAVARALLRAAGGARRLYIADLDAIIDRRPQRRLLCALRAALPQTELWLDAGFADLDAARELCAALAQGGAGGAQGPADAGRAGAGGGVVPVFGSESIADRGVLAALGLAWPDAVLSLDRRGALALDPADCWSAPSLWPRRVIVMTLDRVGSGSGPDLERLAEVRALAPTAELIGAGGVRDEADLRAARAAGAGAWLVASALHDGRLAAAPQA